MGTRLYPITDRTDLIETIAGVSQGTTSFLEDLHQLREDLGSEAWYEMMDQHPDAVRLYDFQLFGFGKLNVEQWAIVRTVCEPGEEYSGRITDKTLVREMLNATQDHWKSTLGLINIEDLDGLCWN